jgi:ankyrin repeat protein
MKACFVAVLELAILVAMTVVVAKQPATLDDLMGMPSPDERLLTAAWAGDPQLVDEALADGASLNARAENGSNVLTCAAWSGQSPMVARLIAEGAEVNSSTDAGWTPLMYAAASDHVGVVRVLLAHGADPYAAIGAEGFNTFEVAATARATQTQELLRDWEQQYRQVSPGFGPAIAGSPTERNPRSGS